MTVIGQTGSQHIPPGRIDDIGRSDAHNQINECRDNDVMAEVPRTRYAARKKPT